MDCYINAHRSTNIGVVFSEFVVYEMPTKAVPQIFIIIVPCQLRDVSLRGVLGELWSVMAKET